MQYLSAARVYSNKQVGAKYITIFQGQLETAQLREITAHASGDSDLHKWLVTNQLFADIDMVRTWSVEWELSKRNGVLRDQGDLAS